MARLLILGGGPGGRALAAEAIGAGHAVRIVPGAGAGVGGEGEDERAEIEALGAECFAGDPDRLGTLRGALEGVAVVCWLLGEAHAERLPAFLGSAVDSTVRAFIFHAPADVAAQAQEIARRNAIPASALSADPRDRDLWLAEARATLSLYI